ncbi:metallophosphoesterase [Sinosporangium siamense]|uniref:metallophosphoesterase n=1 Tax=Sinosporangium siamense TaxID=1367973 RepID=UPI0035EDFFD6
MLTAVVVVVVTHLYLWFRLVRSTTRPGRMRRRLTWVTVALGLLVVVAQVGSRSEFGHWLAWPGFMWLAVMFYLVVFLILLEIPRAIGLLVLRRTAQRGRAVAAPVPVEVAASAVPALVPGPLPVAPEPDPAPPAAGGEGMDRRLFLSRTLAGVAGVGALTTVGFGVRSALGPPVIERVPVVLPKLDPRLNGLRLAVVSDIHLGPITGVSHSERLVRMINSLEADVVAIVGDMVDGTVAELGAAARPLRSLESRYGTFFVTGNHEYYLENGPGEWIEELRELNVRPLQNERVEIAHQGAILDLAGVNDLAGGASGQGPDFDKALGGRDTSRNVVLLAHQPVQVAQASTRGVDLQLSGHTHGGQLVPFNLIVPVQQPVVAGLENVDGTQVYVTRGAGFWGPPVRVGAPPEISLLELRAPNA